MTRAWPGTLELDDRDIAQLEEKVVSKNDDRTQNQSQQSEASNIASQTAEVDATSAVPNSKRVYYSVDRTAPIDLESKKKPRVLDSEIFSFGTDVNAQEFKKIEALREDRISAVKPENLGVFLKDDVFHKHLDSTSSLLKISRKFLSGLLIVCGSLWALFFISQIFFSLSLTDIVVTGIFLSLAGLGLTVIWGWGGVKLRRRLLIVYGSFWTTFFIYYISQSFSGSVIRNLFSFGLGLLAIWGGAKLWRS